MEGGPGPQRPGSIAPQLALLCGVQAVPRQTWWGRWWVAPLVTGVRAVWLSPSRAGLAGLCPTRLRTIPLSQHALVPVGFRREVSWVTLDRPS
jgi:hypothetical protein